MFWKNGIGFRPVEKKDLENIRQLRNEPSTYMQLTDVTLISPAMQERWFDKIGNSSSIAYFSIFEEKKEFPISYEGEFLGIVRMDEIDKTNRSIRIGSDIVPHKRNKGYGTKTYEALMEYLFDDIGFHRLWLCVLDTNVIAQKLYKKVGFKEEGVMRGAIWRNGGWHNYIIMSILEEEYRK